ANGSILVIGGPELIRVDPVTGAQTILSTGGFLEHEPGGIALEANGNILIAAASAPAVIRVDLVTGEQTLIPGGISFLIPMAVAVVGAGVPRYACAGFDDIADTPLKVTRPRTIPLRAELLDRGVPVAGDGLVAAPVVQVAFASGAPAEPPADVTDLVPPPDPAFVGNQFLYKEASARWFHGLQTINMSPPGSYTITMVSGDDREYVIDPPCTATYVIE
ncbi:MAG: hypothetical protein V3T29_09485, partial [Alphaproteobacteria bacterium]